MTTPSDDTTLLLRVTPNEKLVLEYAISRFARDARDQADFHARLPRANPETHPRAAAYTADLVARFQLDAEAAERLWVELCDGSRANAPDLSPTHAEKLLDKHGICPFCDELFEHHYDEPLASCGCRQSEWTGELTPHMEKVGQLEKHRNEAAKVVCDQNAKIIKLERALRLQLEGGQWNTLDRVLRIARQALNTAPNQPPVEK